MSSRTNKENQNNGNKTSSRRVIVEKGVLMKHSKFLGRSQWRKRFAALSHTHLTLRCKESEESKIKHDVPVHAISSIDRGKKPLSICVACDTREFLLACSKLSDFKRWVEAFRIVGCPCDESLFSSSVIRNVKASSEEKETDKDDTYEEDALEEEEKMDSTESKLLLSRRRFGPIVNASSNAILEDALGPSLEYASVRTKDNDGEKTQGWNERYQRLMEETGKITHEELAAKLYRLQHDMAKSATKHVCKFLESAPISRHEPKYDFITRDHLWIRIVDGPFESGLEEEEEEEIDEIDVETRRKIAGHEIRATEALQNALRRLHSRDEKEDKHDVTFSILNQVIVDYLGYRAVVTAIPITQFGDDIEDGTTLKMLASELNFESPNTLINRIVTLEQQVRSETFGQGVVFRQCTERRYILHVNYVTPPDCVDEKHDSLKATDQIERCRLRSSLVRAQSRALSMTPYQVPCADNTALLQYSPHDGHNDNEEQHVVEEIPKAHETFTRHVASSLRRDGVKRFAEMLDSSILPLSPSNLARQAHSYGLNVRHFGLVRSYLKMPHAIRMLEIDMIARCLKRVLNTQLRDLMRRMRNSRHRDITKRAIVLANASLNLTIGPICDDESKRWWNRVLVPNLRRQFVGFKKTQCLPVTSPAASAEICAALTYACAHHCGLVIPALYRQGDDYKMFQSSRVFVVALKPRVKYIHLEEKVDNASRDRVELVRSCLLEEDESALSLALIRLKRFDTAVELSPLGHHTLSFALVRHTYSLWDSKKYEESYRTYRRARQVMRCHQGERSPLLCIWPVSYAMLHVQSSEYSKAAELLKEAIRFGEVTLLSQYWDLRRVYAMLALVMSMMGRADTDEGRHALQRAQFMNRARGGEDLAPCPRALYTMSRALCSSGRYLEAERFLNRCIRVAGTDFATSIRARRLLSSIMARRDTLTLGLEQLDRCVSEMTRESGEDCNETKRKGETRPCVVNACKLEPFSRGSINKQLNDDNVSLSLVLRDVVVDLCGLCVLSVSEKRWYELKKRHTASYSITTNDSISLRRILSSVGKKTPSQIILNALMSDGEEGGDETKSLQRFVLEMARNCALARPRFE